MARWAGMWCTQPTLSCVSSPGQTALLERALLAPITGVQLPGPQPELTGDRWQQCSRGSRKMDEAISAGDPGCEKKSSDRYWR